MKIIKIIACALLICGFGAQAKEDSERNEMVAKFVELANQYDSQEMAKLFSVEEFARTVSSALEFNGRDQRDFEAGIKANHNDYMELLVVNARDNDGTFKYVGESLNTEIVGPMIRVDQNEGMDYLILDLFKVGGKYKIKDLYSVTGGNYWSEQAIKIVRKVIKNEGGFIAKITNKKTFDPVIAEKFKRMGELRVKGNTREAYEILLTLPEEIKNTREFLDLAVQYSSFLDEDTYKSALTKLAEKFGDDPKLAFTLIDFYFYQNDMEKALEKIIVFESYFGEDGKTNLLKSSVGIERNDLPFAEKHAKMCILLEPELEDCYWTVISLLNMQEKYSDLVHEFDILKESFGYEFIKSDFESDEFYEGFVKSKAFKNWSP